MKDPLIITSDHEILPYKIHKHNQINNTIIAEINEMLASMKGNNDNSEEPKKNKNCIRYNNF